MGAKSGRLIVHPTLIRSSWGLIGFLLCLIMPACGPQPPAPSVTLYLENPLLAENIDTKATKGNLQDFQKGWKSLEIGDLEGAQKTFDKLKIDQDWLQPAQVARAYISLMQNQRGRAMAIFREVLKANPANVPALVGLAQAIEADGNPEEAFGVYQQVLTLSPSHSFAQLRRDITRLEVTDLLVRRATEASIQGKTKDAIALFEKAVSLAPERAPLYLELGNLYLRQSDYPRAISSLQQAIDRAPQQIDVKVRLAEALFLNDNLEQARALYKDLLDIDPKNSDYQTRLRMVEDAIKWKTVPQQFKEIPAVRVLTREALAALIAVKLPEAISKQSVPADIAIDIGGWSRDYVLQVIQGGLMDVYTGHLFAPRDPIKRGEAADIASRIIRILRNQFPDIKSPAVSFSSVHDVNPGHVYYSAIQTCLLYGLFQLDSQGDFNSASSMSGEDGVRLVDSLAHLIGR